MALNVSVNWTKFKLLTYTFKRLVWKELGRRKIRGACKRSWM